MRFFYSIFIIIRLFLDLSAEDFKFRSIIQPLLTCRCSLHTGEYTKILFPQKLTDVGYTREYGPTDVATLARLDSPV
jgi:hypothetical protein